MCYMVEIIITILTMIYSVIDVQWLNCESSKRKVKTNLRRTEVLTEMFDAQVRKTQLQSVISHGTHYRTSPALTSYIWNLFGETDINYGLTTASWLMALIDSKIKQLVCMQGSYSQSQRLLIKHYCLHVKSEKRRRSNL